MKDPYLSVIIPSYNEEGRIRKTMDRVREYLNSQDYSYEVIVPIDGATDKTFEILKEYCDAFDYFKVINNKKNHGKGYVVRQGMLEANGQLRVFTDADNSTDIGYLEAMIKKFKEGYDIVISTRDPKDAAGAGQATPQPWLKRQLGNFGNVLIQIFAVPGIWDTQNGFKGFTDKAAENVFSLTRIDGFGFDFEVLALARKLNYKIGIIPIVWRNDPKSHVTFSSYIKTFKELFEVRLGLWTGKYKTPHA